MKIEDGIKWMLIWVDIANSPPSHTPPTFLEYLKNNWFDREVVDKWSQVKRKGRSIYEESDTNMLIEAYVFFYVFVFLP